MVKRDVDGRDHRGPHPARHQQGRLLHPQRDSLWATQTRCVRHARPHGSHVAVANYRDGLLPLSQHALRLRGKVGYSDYCGTFETWRKRAAPARGTRQRRRYRVLGNHGPLVVGKSIRECFSRMYYLERAAGCRRRFQCRIARQRSCAPDEEDCRAMAKCVREWRCGDRPRVELHRAHDWTRSRRTFDEE